MSAIISDYSSHIEQIRPQEYPQLLDTTYLDHAGTTLYAQSTIQSFARDMTSSLYGNPHSASASSALSTVCVNDVRRLVLNFFHADPKKFDLIFVANATAAIRLVAQAFQDRGFWYGYHRDAHTSLVGVRELASQGHKCFTSDTDVESWIDSDLAVSQDDIRLFAYPAQSNMTGYRPPLEWAGKIRSKTRGQSSRTYTLLDAASFLTTGALDLSDHDTAPDFVTLSFYKIFGFPDLGALIVRRESSDVLLSRKYFGGGTVDMVVSVGDSWHQSHDSHPHEALEDGTLPFHNIIALKHAMDVHKRIYHSPLQTSAWATHLSHYAYTELNKLKHYNGTNVVIIYKDSRAEYGQSRTQGPIVAFNVQCPQGKMIGKSRFEALAVACGIQLRTGGVCNPGGIATTLNLSSSEMKRNLLRGMRCGDSVDVLGGKPTGIIRISMGPMSTKGDVQRFIDFVRHFFVWSSESSASRALSLNSSQNLVTSVIHPIDGCLSFPIPFRNFYSTVEADIEYSGLNGGWFIMDLSTGGRLTGHEKQLQQFSVHMDPAQVLMNISYQGPPDNSSSVTSINVNLWEGQDKAAKTITATSYDEPTTVSGFPYLDPKVQHFFTTILGKPCTLARHAKRPRTVPISNRNVCVFWSCNQHFTNAEALKSHYQEHAQAFGQVCETTKTSKKTSRASRQPIRKKSWSDKLYAAAKSNRVVTSEFELGSETFTEKAVYEVHKPSSRALLHGLFKRKVVTTAS